MRTIKEILRLSIELRQSHRDIGKACKKSPATVGECLKRFRASGLAWPLSEEIDDGELERKLYPAAPASADERPIPDWSDVSRELAKKHVTLALLWEEYKSNNPGVAVYGYTWFCRQYREWAKRTAGATTMRQSHKLGERAFIDWAGSKIPIVNPTTGEVTEASLFVACLGYSSYTYAEAFENQKIPAWIAGHCHAFSYFKGATEIVVPDNPKPAVTKADYYDPEINPVYQAWAEHYNAAVLPARPHKPQDKAKVESAVKVAGMWILARLRNMTFFSLNELNAAIWPLLEDLNDRPFQKRPDSRRKCYVELEKAHLRPLPVEDFEIFDFKKARVAPDYHVDVEGHYYSVPYTLVRQLVEVRIKSQLVQIFHQNRMVASHRRNPIRGLHTTVPEHMPPHHRHQAEWTPQRFESWARRSGPGVGEFVAVLLDDRQHPEQAYRACFGLMRLGKKFSNERLDAACLRALELGARRLKNVKNILERGLDKEALPASEPTTRGAGHHENVRGAAYYSQLDLFSEN
jgi:transposase